jgi:DNA-binding IclR family transcriptional regulator
MRLNDIVEIGELSKPTVYRLLKELVNCGLLMRSPDKRYFLGQFAYELGLSASAHFHLREMCQPYVSRIAQETGDTVFLVVRSGPDSFCLDRQTGNYPIKVFSVEVGHRQPLGIGAGGLALLSWLPQDEREAVIARNSVRLSMYGGLDERRLRRLVEEARGAGHSRIADFAIPGVTGVGVPVLDRVGVPMLALSVTSVSARMAPSHQGEALHVLCQEAAKLQGLLNNTAPALRK